MTHRVIRGAMGIAAIAALVSVVMGMRMPTIVAAMSVESKSESAAPQDNPTDPAGELMKLADKVAPFRATGEVPSIRFGEAPPPPTPPPPPKPALSLSGILWGKEPAAILEGIPGREGQVVLRQGHGDGVLRVTRIDTASVVITGLDTTWVLRVRQPW